VSQPPERIDTERRTTRQARTAWVPVNDSGTQYATSGGSLKTSFMILIIIPKLPSLAVIAPSPERTKMAFRRDANADLSRTRLRQT